TLAADDPRRYAWVVVLARAGFDPREVKHDLFATDHAAVGAAITDAWRLPGALACAVAGHHDGDGGALGDALWQARHAATLLGLGDDVLPGGGGSSVGARRGAPTLLQAVEWYRAAITGRA
ncbi:MAG: HDOD domain-containing protein, partial [Chloroflexi bacterium]|nr:HDOD domain-containing protein [Chloroflexota bacterium]